ncbi:MAG: hypothetical protein M1831_006071 [Alyxoria varia]|nr:MAG: hypothetical protein M1831_006071 [Alyxoria varia]
MHALTEMVRQLRERRDNILGSEPPQNGLILANGGVATYQHVVCLSTRPRTDGAAYPKANPLPAVVSEVSTPQIAERAEGPAVIETYTVDFGRDGRPILGHVVGRLKNNGNNNRRFLANHADPQTLEQLSSWTTEPIGRTGYVTQDVDGRNLFRFDSVARL